MSDELITNPSSFKTSGGSKNKNFHPKPETILHSARRSDRVKINSPETTSAAEPKAVPVQVPEKKVVLQNSRQTKGNNTKIHTPVISDQRTKHTKDKPSVSDFAFKKRSIDAGIVAPKTQPKQQKQPEQSEQPKPIVLSNTIIEKQPDTNVSNSVKVNESTPKETNQTGGNTMDIPNVDLEEFEDAVEEKQQQELESEEEIKDEAGGSLKLGIIGAGQCGGRIGEAFWQLGYKKAISINTTEQDKNNIPTKIILSVPGKHGGAGKDMEVALDSFDSNKDEVFNTMQTTFGQVDYIFVCAGLGGGSGGGTVVGLTELAKRYMKYIGQDEPEKRVGAVITLPSVGEAASPTVANNALEKGREISKLADACGISPLIVIDNNRVKELYKRLPPAKFFPTINSTVAQMFHIFNVISSESSDYITVDATDFISTLQCGGHLIMGVTVVPEYKTKTGISTALKQNLTKTLLASDFDLTTAKVVTCIVVAGKEILAETEGLMENIEFGFDALANITGNAMVHRGLYEDENTEKVRVYTMISGLTAPVKRYKKLEK